MNDAFQQYSWLAIFAAIALWALLAYAEYRRYGKGRRAYLRIGMLLVAVAAMLLALLKPTYRAKGASTTLVLNGSAEQQLDSLLEMYPAATVLSLQPHARYQQLEGLSYLSRYVSPGSQVFLLGEAPANEEFNDLKMFKLHYLPPNKTMGLQSLNYQHEVRMADSLVVKGRWFSAKGESKMILSGGGVVLDSAVAVKATNQDFVLKAPALVSGSQVYRLEVIQEGDTLQTYRLPLQVQAAKSYKFALLTAFPEAESKYLKDFLGNQGYGLQYGAQLAPGKEIQEWINLPRHNFQYAPNALKTWDALIVSASHWSSLGASRQQALTANQQQAGSGLLIYPDGEQSSIVWQGKRIAFGQQVVNDTLLIDGVRVPLEYKPFQQLPVGWEVVLKGPKGIAAISRRHGLGKVVLSAGVDSYTLLLKGLEAGYGQYWNRLLEEILPLEEKTAQWEQPLEASIHRPMQLLFQTQDSLPQARVRSPDGNILSLTFWQDAQQPTYWKTLFWPKNTGWHTAEVAGDTLKFWVAESLTSLAQAKAQDRLSLFFAQQAPIPQVDRYEEKPLPIWLYYVLFLTSMGILWLEKKING